jgi:hypothetical protein
MLGLFVVCAGRLAAGNFSLIGTFGSDDQVQLFDLSLSSPSSVTFQTFSYGGGVNAAGTTIGAGGFDPRLTWFGADGTQIGSDNGGHCESTNAWLGACDDAFFQGTLDAGDYVLVLTQDGNDANGDLSDGFSAQGLGDFTASGDCAQFCDVLSGQALNGNWAVDILTVDSASAESATPEPAPIELTLIGLSLIALASRNNAFHSKGLP